ncbi:MAG: signal recognition particle protein, partial [Oscillospiraceae bacterium]
ELVSLMGNENKKIHFASKPPTIILMCGLQGTGKTTHTAKLGKHFKKEGHRPLLVACDIYRPAAIEQLKVVGAKAEVPVFEMGQENPVKIAQKAVSHAKDNGYDIVILDTAGRLHVDDALMQELKDIKSAVDVSEVMLVVDAMTGQDAVNVATSFNDTIGIDSVMLTKLDGDTRGGAALSVLAVTGKPIKFSGIGEKLDDLEVFHPERMASRILGMGDVLTLIEKAKADINEEEAVDMIKRMKENNFNMNDLLSQMQQIKKMGSLKSVASMIPGVGNKLANVDMDDKQLVYIEALITSMTKEERLKPSIITANRKKRIAKGAGQKVEDVNKLLKQLEQMQKMMKQMTGNKAKQKPNKKRKKR